MKTMTLPNVFLSLFRGVGILVFGLPIPSSGAELNVGSKIVYPGGADQPPKEKDVGVKLKVEPVSSSIETQEEFASEEDLAVLLSDGQTSKILSFTADKKDPSSQAYRALALFAVDRKKEAEQVARKVLKSDDLSSDLRDKLEEALTKLQSSQEPLKE